VLALALLVTAVGYFALLLKKEASKARVGVSVGLIILGVAGTLEGALSFTAPVETALSEAQARLTAECPIFTPAAVRTIGGKIPPDSAAEVYFRTAWSWAVKGQGQLDAAAVAELGQLMGEVFSAMPEGERRRFGAYTEKVRGGRRTSRAEDAAAMRALGRAAGKLSPGSLGRLQILTETALSVGALL
jgi:hypothetical protein